MEAKTKIRLEMTRSGLNVDALAARAKISPPTVLRALNGVKISDATMNKIAKALCIEPAELIEQEADEEDRRKSAEKELLSAAETAKILRISPPIVYQLAKRQDFPSFKIGQRVLVHRVGLENWIIEQMANHAEVAL